MIVLKILAITFIAVVILGPLHVRSEESKLINVSADGSVLVGDDTTLGQGKAAALNNARRGALEKATGVEVRGSSTVYNFELINDLVMTATRGLIVGEKVLENKCQSRDEFIYCSAKIDAVVKPLNLERRGNFSVTRVEVRRPDRREASGSPVFQCYDEIQVRASANQDAFLSIFSVDQYGGLSRLMPNEYCGFEKTLAGKEAVFPDEAQRKSGLRMKVKTPKGVKKSVESVLVIATREKVDFLQGAGLENPTITDLMRELSELDPSLWAEKTVGYEVRE